MDDILTFEYFCTRCEQIYTTRKRLEIQQILTSYYKKLSNNQDALTTVLYLSTASFLPEHHNKELGIGDLTVMKVVCETTGRKMKAVREELRVAGDLGTIAMKYRIKPLLESSSRLTCDDVLRGLRGICEEQVNRSTQAKMNRMISLIRKSRGIEAKYLVRLFECKLKIGLALKTVLISLAQALRGEGDERGAVENVKYAYNQHPIFEDIVAQLARHGPERLLSPLSIQPGVPVKPMLAQPSKNITAAYKRVEGGLFTCEYKYDGERAQIHSSKGLYKVFSRNSENLTEKYPDLCPVLERINREKVDFIIDAEIVAYCLDSKRILPFQTLATRKRKNVKLEDIKIQVCVFVFDCLFYSKSLLEESLSQRRKILFDNFNLEEQLFKVVSYKDCESVEEIEEVFSRSTKEGCEGLMIKNLDSLYKPSMRSTSWIKLKKDYLEGMSDSLDLLVVGAYYGKGKRTGCYGGFLLACYNDEEESYEAICKIGTGFDEAGLSSIYSELQPFITASPVNYVYTENVKPDLWVSPCLVWEVRAAGFSSSPIYSAAYKKNEGTGISLRFPRFVRRREDKGVKDVTTSEQVIFMYREYDRDDKDSEDEFN